MKKLSKTNKKRNIVIAKHLDVRTSIGVVRVYGLEGAILESLASEFERGNADGSRSPIRWLWTEEDDAELGEKILPRVCEQLGPPKSADELANAFGLQTRSGCAKELSDEDKANLIRATLGLSGTSGSTAAVLGREARFVWFSYKRSLETNQKNIVEWPGGDVISCLHLARLAAHAEVLGNTDASYPDSKCASKDCPKACAEKQLLDSIPDGLEILGNLTRRLNREAFHHRRMQRKIERGCLITIGETPCAAGDVSYATLSRAKAFDYLADVGLHMVSAARIRPQRELVYRIVEESARSIGLRTSAVDAWKKFKAQFRPYEGEEHLEIGSPRYDQATDTVLLKVDQEGARKQAKALRGVRHLTRADFFKRWMSLQKEQL